MTCLEGYAALVSITTVPDRVRNKEILIFFDNSGFVFAYKKKSSICPYSYTIPKAVYEVGRGLACRVRVEKTLRCSAPGEIATDALSKGDFTPFQHLAKGRDTSPARIPTALVQWINNPVCVLMLGLRLLADMVQSTEVLFNN